MAVAFLLGLALPLSACAVKPIDMMEAAPETLRGAAYVDSVELSLNATARAAVKASDAKLHGEGDAALPFAQLFDKAVKEATRARGLEAGRPLRVTVEMDALRIPDAAMAVLGRSDRLAGQVIVRDARTGDRLALFYVTVDKEHSGLIGLAIRGGGVREKLVREFAAHIAEQLAAPRHSRSQAGPFPTPLSLDGMSRHQGLVRGTRPGGSWIRRLGGSAAWSELGEGDSAGESSPTLSPEGSLRLRIPPPSRGRGTSGNPRSLAPAPARTE